MAESWVRLWAGMTTDPKWQTVARKSGQPRALVIAVFTHLMLVANDADPRGSLDELVVEDLASAMDCDEEAVEAILEAMRGRVIDDENCLSGWRRRQPLREDSGEPEGGVLSSTERSRNRRRRLREERDANAGNGDATQGNAGNGDATQSHAPEAEAEAETETEEKEAAAAPPCAPACETSPPDAAPPGWTPPPGADAAPSRPAQIAVLLRRNGADPATHPGSKGIAELAASGAADVQILSALETAKQRRKDQGSAQPVTAAYLLPIVREALAAPPARASPGRAGKFDPSEFVNRNRISRQSAQEHRHDDPPDHRTIDVDAVRLD